MINLILYTGSWCVSCKGVKKLLDEAGISYDQADITSDIGMQDAKQYNIKALPTMRIGDVLLVGSKQITVEKIREVLGD